jgi:hypothetical protein
MVALRYGMKSSLGPDTILTVAKADSVFSGISTFGRLPYFPCLASDHEKFDIAFIGMRTHSAKNERS